MAKPELRIAKETLLRKRLSDFLYARSEQKSPLIDALSRIETNNWKAVIFGGVLRDLAIFGPSEVPRDIDVVADVPPSELERVFGDLISSKNRFGGLRLQLSDWSIDIWTLENTWALQNEPTAAPSFDRLVHTTFLNVEAIAAEISQKQGQQRRIYSAGFFETMRKRILDISFEPNPYPQLCVVRSIITALKLKWVVSQRLARYIVKEAATVPMQTLLDVQRSHYGNSRILAPEIQRHLKTLENKLRDSNAETIQIV